MESHQPTNDSTTLNVTATQQDGHHLSQYANSLDRPTMTPDTAAQNALHPLDIFSGAASAIENLYEHPSQITDAVKSAINTIEGSKIATFISDSLTESVKAKEQLTPAGKGMVALGEYGGF